nr:hypothetical protein [Tanacetum cinerariifolium]
MAFVSSNSISSTNEADTTASGVSTAHTQDTTVNSTSVDNLSDAVICAFLASQPNSPQLVKEDLEQIDPDNLEEMDQHWEMAMLTIRAQRFTVCRKRLVHYKKNEAILTDKINVLNLKVKQRDKVLVDYTKNLDKAEKERDELKLTLEKLRNSSKALNNLLDSQVSDKFKAGLGYKEITPDCFVNSSEKQENRSDKGYHAVPLPFTENYMPLKRDLRLIDEHFESMSMDFISNIEPSDVKTVNTIDVNHKGVFSTEEPKPVMKNNFSLSIIEEWH